MVVRYFERVTIVWHPGNAVFLKLVCWHGGETTVTRCKFYQKDILWA